MRLLEPTWLVAQRCALAALLAVVSVAACGNAPPARQPAAPPRRHTTDGVSTPRPPAPRPEARPCAAVHLGAPPAPRLRRPSSRQARPLRRGRGPSGGRRILARRSGRFGPVYVVSVRGIRALRFGHPDAEDQSAFDPAHPHLEPLEYIQAALAALAWAPSGSAGRPRVLVLGLGGGSFVRHTLRLRPRARVTAVEIDPVVARLARRFFGLQSLPMQLRLMDARAFLARSHTQFDVVLVDAYDDEDYPRHLGTRAFFRLVRAHLGPGAVVVANLSPNRLRDRDDLVRTFRSVFPRSLCFEAPPGGNTLVFGGPGISRSGPAARRARLAHFARRAPALGSLARLLRSPCRFSLRGARILRDPPGRPRRRSRSPLR